ncbi:phenylalanine 4-monooxygenase [Burkholderia diffusa]|uniref:Phenylalanine-4-hydroxylase n=1 Tax=Burkholderia diffusa TaxID=488732 RepID=A0A6P2MFA1_9BURK|nr:phenylalanine 4-monooxygenase [Burkholderia diffusa]KAB0654192.1 phenylalanine 4-monooxygenase [Burkholderia diffusa]MBM2652833.1 phenylalanine 4-monooxygenase [Burkholderia diffusa]VWB77673.1 phenylalanine 4-monooxygenase [Burkholderia diffusa]
MVPNHSVQSLTMSTVVTAKLQEQFDAGLETRADFTIDQPLERYGQVDHAVWQQLYARQSALLRGRACGAFIAGLWKIDLPADRVPSFADVNRQLKPATGWEIVAVPGLVPDRVFFEHLANRRFPVTWWMRRPDQLDYLQEPDCFHDLFGHVPLLIEPVFADYMQAYGRTALAVADDEAALARLARLYWYTVEFGLIRDTNGTNGLSIYGAGIVSSKGESLYSLESAAPNRLGFDLERVMRTRYRIDTFQKTYFVIDDFAQLFALADVDGRALADRLAPLSEFPAGAVVDRDLVLHRGTGEGWPDDADA